jgi:MFS family permease
VAIGLGAVVLGTLPFLFATPETSVFLFIAALLVRGAGLGCVNVPIMATVYNGLKKEEITQGTIAARLLQQIGGAFGTAILAALYQYYLRGGSSPQAVTGAFRLVFAWTIGFTVISIIPALMLPYNKRNVAADKILEAL